MKVILTGSTGFIGGGVLSQCLQHPAITSIIVLSRRALPDSVLSPKVKVIIMDDFASYPDNVLKEIAGADACLWWVSGNTLDTMANDNNTGQLVVLATFRLLL